MFRAGPGKDICCTDALAKHFHVAAPEKVISRGNQSPKTLSSFIRTIKLRKGEADTLNQLMLPLRGEPLSGSRVHVA